LTTLTGHTSYLSGVAFSPDSQFLATSSYDETVRLWQLG
jgi:WD40 repeat protein